MTTDRSSPPPPPPEGRSTPLPPEVRRASYPEGALDGLLRPETPGERALRIVLKLRDQIGHPPVEASGEAGTGLWSRFAELRAICLDVRAWTRAADVAEARRSSVASRVAWIVATIVLTLALGAGAAYLGFHR